MKKKKKPHFGSCFVFVLFLFAGLSTISLASSTTSTNVTASPTPTPSETKNKRQIHHQTRVIGSNSGERNHPSQVTQTIYGQHSPGQFITRPIQVDQDQQHANRQQHEVNESQN